MSSAAAIFYTPSGEVIAYGTYSGTSDVLSPIMAEDFTTAYKIDKGQAKRPDGRNSWDVLDDCKHDPEPAVVHSKYGGGLYWDVTVCRTCMVTHGPLSPYPIDRYTPDPSPPVDYKKGAPIFTATTNQENKTDDK